MFSYATNVLPDASAGHKSSDVYEQYFSEARYANPDVSNWDTSAVTAMNDMFREARSARPDVSNWDVEMLKPFVICLQMLTKPTGANTDGNLHPLPRQ